jgi:hypothetical protein
MNYTLLMAVFSCTLGLSECAAVNLTYLERGDVDRSVVLPLTPNLTVSQFTVCFRFWENRFGDNRFVLVRDKVDLTMSSSTVGNGQPRNFIDSSRTVNKMNESLQRLVVQDSIANS